MVYSIGTEKEILKKEFSQYFIDNYPKKGVSIKADFIDFVLNQSKITLYDGQNFFGDIDCVGLTTFDLFNNLQSFYTEEAVKTLLNGYRYGHQADCYGGGNDFNHTAPIIKTVLDLGFNGIIIKAQTLPDGDFKSRLIRAYEGVKTLIDRTIELAKNLNDGQTIISNLKFIKDNPPKTLYQAMQVMIIYFTLQLKVDGISPRTLGRLDNILYPYYERDIKNGELTKETARSLVKDFLIRLAEFKVEANLPFSIGGVIKGQETSNQLSYVILEEFITLASPHLKIHFLYSNKTPKTLFNLAIKGIIGGSNSIVFMCDDAVKKGLVSVGVDPADADEYSIVGCYEPASKEETPCSCAGFINLLKAVELTLYGGVDPKTGLTVIPNLETQFKDFDHFYSTVKHALNFFAEGVKKYLNFRESFWNKANSGIFISSTFKHCFENAKDAYCDYGAKYNNTSVNANGLANFADAVYAIKKLVFDEKVLTLEQFKTVLLSNWESDPKLRLKIKNKLPKFGNDDDSVDIYAVEALELLNNAINRAKNVKGGVYRLGAFTVQDRIYHGSKTTATPDGRFDGEPLAKNLYPSLGSDKNGIPAVINSVVKYKSTHYPNGSVLDLVFHRSSTSGKDGEKLLENVVTTYFNMGGFAVHINVLDPAILKKAKTSPEKYPNLQVRLCGWNVLFSTLSPKEQEEFIFNAENNY